MEKQNDLFKFQISLSVLNHLGRNLYRNFITVIGEAISNSWDADAKNVWIDIDREKNLLIVQDDGIGMDDDDFQDKFLKVGYSKRKYGGMNSPSGRPYVGAKGIGKLALLSCADIITIASKKSGGAITGGTINNSRLDEEIANDKTTEQYILEPLKIETWQQLINKREKGTFLIFQNIKENIRNTIPYLRELIALYFRFSLLDNEFNIHVNDETVTLKHLSKLCEKTEFLWSINNHKDPIYDEFKNLLEKVDLSSDFEIDGFIASVDKPRFLKISGTNQKAGIDLFVNGRLRERNILKHLPDYSTRWVASYIYGQIHFNNLDDDLEGKRFTSSREGIVPGDPLYKKMMEILKPLLGKISDNWDILRMKYHKDGDPENTKNYTKKEKKAINLYNESRKEFVPEGNKEVDDWINQIEPDAAFNIPAYVDCFLSENLLRKYINNKHITLTQPAINEINQWKASEASRMNAANISFSIRQNQDDLSYLGMDFLAKTIDGNINNNNSASLVRDATEYKPMRNAVGHTGLLTHNAKSKLNLVYENIKARIKALLGT